MYQFKDLTTSSNDEAVESSYGLIFDGVDLESEIPGFLTLSVSGRGIMSREIVSTKSPGKDGVNYIDSVLPPREIKVGYQIAAPNADDLRRRLEKLNALLHDRQLHSIRFKDDILYHFRGSIAGTSDPDEKSNTYKGEINLFCPIPFKYGAAVPLSGTIITYVGSDSTVGLIADFSFVAGVSAPFVEIRNSLSQAIRIGPVVAGRTYTLNLSGDKPEILENGLRKMTLMSITAGLEAFRIEPGLSYNLSNGGSLSATFYEVRL